MNVIHAGLQGTSYGAVHLAGLQAGNGNSGLSFPDRLSDFDGDDDLDATDLEALVNWMTGPVE